MIASTRARTGSEVGFPAAGPRAEIGGARARWRASTKVCLAGLGVALSVLLGSCSAHDGELEMGATSQALTVTRQFFVDIPFEGRPEDFLFGANGNLYVNDGIWALEGDGHSAALSNVGIVPPNVMGSLTTNVGANAFVGNIHSNPLVTLRSSATVDGMITTASPMSEQDGIRSPGFNSTPVVDVRRFIWDVVFPQPPQPGVQLEPNQNATLAPGAFGPTMVKTGSSLSLSTGRYTFQSLSFEPGSRLALDERGGPIEVYVDSDFFFRGTIAEAGDTAQLLLGVWGPYVSIEAPFTGTIAAPNATLELRSINGSSTKSAVLDDVRADLVLGAPLALRSHRGAFFARDIIAHQETLLVHQPARAWVDSIGFSLGLSGACSEAACDRHDLCCAAGLACEVDRPVEEERGRFTCQAELGSSCAADADCRQHDPRTPPSGCVANACALLSAQLNQPCVNNAHCIGSNELANVFCETPHALFRPDGSGLCKIAPGGLCNSGNQCGASLCRGPAFCDSICVDGSPTCINELRGDTGCQYGADDCNRCVHDVVGSFNRLGREVAGARFGLAAQSGAFIAGSGFHVGQSYPPFGHALPATSVDIDFSIQFGVEPLPRPSSIFGRFAASLANLTVGPLVDAVRFFARPEVGSALGHLQSIQRLPGVGNENWMVYAKSEVDNDDNGTLFFVALAPGAQQLPNSGEPFFRDSVLPPSEVLVYRHLDFPHLSRRGSNHPGGMQIIGKRLAVAYDSEGIDVARGSLDRLAFVDFYDVSDPHAVRLHGVLPLYRPSQAFNVVTITGGDDILFTPRGSGAAEPPASASATSVGVAKLAEGDHLVFVQDKDTDRRGWFFRGRLGFGPWTFVGNVEGADTVFQDFPAPNHFLGYQNTALVTECETGDVYLIGGENPGFGNAVGEAIDVPGGRFLTRIIGGADTEYLDLFRIDTRTGALRLESISRQVLVPRQVGLTCSLRSGMGVHVTPNGQLVLYCNSHGFGLRIGEHVREVAQLLIDATLGLTIDPTSSRPLRSIANTFSADDDSVAFEEYFSDEF